jgi:hypothetical protein
MSRKIKLLIGLVVFLSAITYGLVNAGVISFVDGVDIQYVAATYEDQVPSKAEAENLLMPLSGSFTPSAHLEKNSGGCRIKLGNFFLPSPTEVYFWQGYSWGQATTTPDCSSAANSCICPAGTTRVLRRSQDKSINQLDTTWWKDFSYSSSGSHNFVAGWTTQCTEYSYYWPAGSPQCPGAGGPAETNSNCCGYVLNNCKDLLDSDDGCAGSQPMNYTEYIYNCVANSEILKQ